jgi:hypothetical protein
MGCGLAPRFNAQHIDEKAPPVRFDCPEGSSDCESSSETDLGWHGASMSRATPSFGTGCFVPSSAVSDWTLLDRESDPLLTTRRLRL